MPRILIVDDDRATLEVIETLINDAGYTTAPAGGLFHEMPTRVWREAGRRTDT